MAQEPSDAYLEVGGALEWRGHPLDLPHEPPSLGPAPEQPIFPWLGFLIPLAALISAVWLMFTIEGATKFVPAVVLGFSICNITQVIAYHHYDVRIYRETIQLRKARLAMWTRMRQRVMDDWVSFGHDD